MSIRDFSQDLHKSSRTVGFEKILSILQSLQKQTPKIEDDDLLRFFMFGPLSDIHNTDILFSGESILDFSGYHHYNQNEYRKYIPQQSKVYDLQHNHTQATGVTFTMNGATSTKPPKFGAGAFTDGNSIITIADDPILNPTDSISIAFWIYVPEGLTTFTPFLEKRHLGEDFSFSFLISHFANNRFACRFKESNGNICILNAPAEANQWVHVVMTFSENDTTKIYTNGVLRESLNTTSSLNVVDTTIQIFKSVGYTPAGVGLAWLSIIHGDVSKVPNWISNDYIGIRDLDQNANSNLEEILSIPFANSLDPQPNATTGLFYAN